MTEWFCTIKVYYIYDVTSFSFTSAC